MGFYGAAMMFQWFIAVFSVREPASAA